MREPIGAVDAFDQAEPAPQGRDRDRALCRSACHRGRAGQIAALKRLDAIDREQPAVGFGFDRRRLVFEPRPGSCAAWRCVQVRRCFLRVLEEPALRELEPRRGGQQLDVILEPAAAADPRASERRALVVGAQRPPLRGRALVDLPLRARQPWEPQCRELGRSVELLSPYAHAFPLIPRG
jgi:hypothetical protein